MALVLPKLRISEAGADEWWKRLVDKEVVLADDAQR